MANFIKPCEGRITSHFMPSRLNPVTGVWQAHKGIDYGKDGSPHIIAAEAGTVTRAEVIGGYGNTVTIKHVITGKKYETLYAHLTSFCVKVGQVVKQGEHIGIKGSTGNSTGVHLHFEIHDPSYAPGQPNVVDPFPLVTDPEVVELQELLNKNGYKLIVDGIAGDVTEKSVKDFQQKNELIVDGIAGVNTLVKLKQADKAVASLSSSEKIMWGKKELKPGQIGKITILRPVNLWTDLETGKLVEVRVLNPTEEYRVYGYRELYGGQYDVGGGNWVTKMDGYIKYVTPSKAMLAQLNNIK